MIPADVFYARLHRVIPAAAGFVTDADDRVLLVKPNYRDLWGWPGGHVDEGETPEEACGRELREEVGLTLPVGRLLVVHWVPEKDERPFPLVHFTFDCGTLPDGARISLQEEELDDWGFFTPAEADKILPDWQAMRLHASVAARASGGLTYLS
ncbi:NUDIX domain-containing protein [Herbidospora yilanensis]|uniref:NUDIX domain-containing protein n=1 Tax=Herbidospora yilanensis TaxID=354426 RepID=UPI000785AEA2|nr:NUDIX hydrolase [Herbidospora yilanensis]